MARPLDHHLDAGILGTLVGAIVAYRLAASANASLAWGIGALFLLGVGLHVSVAQSWASAGAVAWVVLGERLVEPGQWAGAALVVGTVTVYLWLQRGNGKAALR